MIRLAEELSKNIPFVRSDFYEINGQLYFGELTFYPGSGLEEFTPPEWDRRLGELIKLPHIDPFVTIKIIYGRDENFSRNELL